MEVFNDDGFSIARTLIEDSDSNYNYIIWCNKTKECAVIDPIDPIMLLNFIRDNGLMVKYVINTHCHPDHISGNDPILKVSLSLISKALVHPAGIELIGTRYETIDEGDVIKVGDVDINVIHTPGHCPEHVSLIVGDNIFVGDTVFQGGAGNILHRGVVEDLYKSLSRIRELSDNYRMFVGHEYAQTNLKFTLDLDPQNQAAIDKLNEIEKSISENKSIPPSTLGEEKQYNPFMRYDESTIIDELKKRDPDLKTDPESVFTKLRELRNTWTS